MRSFRTPTVLRGFLLAATTLFPILFAPYFAHAAHESDGPVWPAYVLSVGMAVANAVLVNIQKALEDPFDGDTADDIELDALRADLGVLGADARRRLARPRPCPRAATRRGHDQTARMCVPV